MQVPYTLTDIGHNEGDRVDLYLLSKWPNPRTNYPILSCLRFHRAQFRGPNSRGGPREYFPKHAD